MRIKLFGVTVLFRPYLVAVLLAGESSTAVEVVVTAETRKTREAESRRECILADTGCRSDG